MGNYFECLEYTINTYKKATKKLLEMYIKQ